MLHQKVLYLMLWMGLMVMWKMMKTDTTIKNKMRMDMIKKDLMIIDIQGVPLRMNQLFQIFQLIQVYLITNSKFLFDTIDQLFDALVSVEEEEVNEVQWNGFKIVGDNIDMNVVPRHKRIDKQTKSLHFFQTFAVRDRLDLSSASEDPNPFLYKPVSELPINDLLPSVSDDMTLLNNISILIGRILVKEVRYFSDTFHDVTTKHMKHMHYQEMSKKSETVSSFLKIF